MDRVMQMELDTLALERLDVLKTHLASFSGGVDIPFIDGDTLCRVARVGDELHFTGVLVGATAIHGNEDHTW